VAFAVDRPLTVVLRTLCLLPTCPCAAGVPGSQRVSCQRLLRRDSV
jgi:hypothetical protein